MSLSLPGQVSLNKKFWLQSRVFSNQQQIYLLLHVLNLKNSGYSCVKLYDQNGENIWIANKNEEKNRISYPMGWQYALFSE